MATVSSTRSFDAAADRTADNILSVLRSTLYFFGSLKLTVALFAISMVLVFVGTLAQHDLNMLEVKQRYFTSWIAALHFNDMLPPAFFPPRESDSIFAYRGPYEGFVWIPGGALVGLLLMINLVCAKITRFHIHASGPRLATGIGIILLGLLATAGIIISGHNTEGLQGEPPMSYQNLWAMCLGVLAAGWLGVTAVAVASTSTTARIAWGTVSLALAVYLIFSLTTGYRVGDPGLRIVWQLAKGLGAGLILLVGCLLIFRKQGGNVLLHFGVGLLMVGQFVFGDRQSEQRLNLIEGHSANEFVNLDKVELAFIRDEEDGKRVVAVSDRQLRRAADSQEVIRDERLPADIRVLAYFRNSRLAEPSDAGHGHKADQGFGRRLAAVPAPGAGGTGGEINLASAYVELLDRDSGKALGTHLVSQWFSDRSVAVEAENAKDEFDSVSVGEDEYRLGLRFARTPKPFWIHLREVRRVDYSGTDTPRDYRSLIRIVDPETGEDRREEIWMNNPLRFRGETYYQSNYTRLPSGAEMTGLQIVRNSGWLIPYVACSITALGMCVHFGGTLRRFVRRRAQERRLAFERAVAGASPGAGGPGFRSSGGPVFRSSGKMPLSPYGTESGGETGAAAIDAEPEKPSRLPSYLMIGGAALLGILLLVPWKPVYHSWRPVERDRTMDMHAAGQIPVQFGGRVMPLAAYSQQMLTAISNRSSLKLDDAPGAIRDRIDNRRSLSAMNWLFEVAIDDERLDDLPMFRVDAVEVRDELNLPRRKSKLVSLNEIRREIDRFTELTDAAREKDPRDQSFKEKKLLELDRRIRAFTMTAVAFRLPVPADLPESFFPEGTTPEQRRMFAVQRLQAQMASLERMPSPGVIPPPQEVLAESDDVPKWSAFASAFFNDALEGARRQSDPSLHTPRPAIDAFSNVITAYSDKDPQKFNEAVDAHLAAVGDVAGDSAGYLPWKVQLERWDQAVGPTYVAMLLYGLALVLGLAYLMFDRPSLRSGVWGIVLVALTIHTGVLLSRIMITGRAPVINLYSSAVFIGWAGVIFGVIQERIFRYGEGNLLSAGSGVLSLLVAYGLSGGDTMPVLQAVLDTQFWLGTHVITVTLGYAATMVAGLLGIRYLVAGWLGADSQDLRQIYRSVYGATCFGILFSFVGTVLGGLWADDSWGRFWGWDPKENGALLIVIWNALMLHARWDGMVSGRGFSILAIGGNIVTAWSYFGTNELGIGLHSYGFTEGVLMWLTVFNLSQLAFIVAGLIFPPRTSPHEDRPAIG